MEQNNNSGAANTAPEQVTQNTESTEASEALDNVTEQGLDGQDSSEETKAETKEEQKQFKKLKKLKLKVDGKELEEELPFEIDDDPRIVEYMQKQLQLSKMAQKRAKEASESKQKLDEVGKFLQEVQGNPKKFRQLAKELGISERELASQILEEEIEASKKSPEQLEKERLEQELKRLQDERDREKKDFEQREFERLQEQEFVRYDKMIDDAIGSSSLPKSPYVVKKVADYLLLGLQNKMELEAKDVIPLVEEEIRDEIREMFSAMPVDAAEAFLGKEFFKNVRKKNLEKMKTPSVPVEKAIVETGTTKKTVQNDKTSMRKYFGF